MSARKRAKKATFKGRSAKRASTRKKPVGFEKAVAAKKKASAKKKAPAKTAMRPKKSEWATAMPIGLEEHLASLAASELLSAAPKGACLVTDPNTGSARCTLATRDFCQKTLKGVFIGGPCGG